MPAFSAGERCGKGALSVEGLGIASVLDNECAAVVGLLLGGNEPENEFGAVVDSKWELEAICGLEETEGL